jgi:hypothetical protein
MSMYLNIKFNNIAHNLQQIYQYTYYKVQHMPDRYVINKECQSNNVEFLIKRVPLEIYQMF